jgi:hypothetical protein
MKEAIVPHRLNQLLIEQGLVPPNCRLLTVEFAVMEAAIIRYEVFLTGDDLLKFAAAFTEAVVPVDRGRSRDGEDESPGPARAR